MMRPQGRPGHVGKIVSLGWLGDASVIRGAGGGGWGEGGLGFPASAAAPSTQCWISGS